MMSIKLLGAAPQRRPRRRPQRRGVTAEPRWSPAPTSSSASTSSECRTDDIARAPDGVPWLKTPAALERPTLTEGVCSDPFSPCGPDPGDPSDLRCCPQQLPTSRPAGAEQHFREVIFGRNSANSGRVAPSTFGLAGIAGDLSGRRSEELSSASSVSSQSFRKPCSRTAPHAFRLHHPAVPHRRSNCTSTPAQLLASSTPNSVDTAQPDFGRHVSLFLEGAPNLVEPTLNSVEVARSWVKGFPKLVEAAPNLADMCSVDTAQLWSEPQQSWWKSPHMVDPVQTVSKPHQTWSEPCRNGCTNSAASG